MVWIWQPRSPWPGTLGLHQHCCGPADDIQEQLASNIPTQNATSNNSSDPRRVDKIVRYKPSAQGTPGAPGEDPTTDYMNVLGMIFSMCGLMMRLKWCAWVALYCSCISFANSRVNDDTKQMLSSFMLSISAVVMSYLQNPQPMTPPWSNI
ncbi:protein Asterix-like [Procambarus clarkii]|uniref:protein Asterix-like n=1 Tax=Procambarus clarkii TaxID=6728 RepID=UPI003742E6A4